jgi:hypothetical protein
LAAANAASGVAQPRGRVFSPASVRLGEGAGFVRLYAREDGVGIAMPTSAPPLASNPAQNALPMTALTPGIIRMRNPIPMQAKQVRIRKDAFAATLTPPRVPVAARRLAYQRRAKTAIDAATRMEGLPQRLALHCGRMHRAGAAASRRL